MSRLIGAGNHAATLRLVALMVLSALTEGLGIMLLVPLLGALVPANGDAISAKLAQWGVSPTLPQILILFVVLVMLRAGINHARNAAALRLELAVVDGLRLRAWRALLHADWRTLSAMRRSDSASMLISNIDRAGFGVNQAGAGLATLITLGGLAAAGLTVAPALVLGGVLGGVVVLALYAGMRRRAAHIGEALGEAYRAMHGSVTENLDALRFVKSVQGEAQAEQAALTGFTAVARSRIAYQRDLGRGQIALHSGGAIVLALLVWLAAGRGGIGPGQLLPVVALFARTIPLVGSLQECWQNYAYAKPAIASALAMIDQAEAAREPDLPHEPPPRLSHEIALQDVAVLFAGSAALALDGISLTLPAHGVVALVGASGAGKSTLADVLGGLITPDRGALLIDGKALDAAQRRAWRGVVAYVQQDPAVLADTVRANLLWGTPDASPARIEAALGDAACRFVLDWPDGLETRIGDGGRTMSGGERQRLILARALLRDPQLLILDEATSALDAESEAEIARAISALRTRMAILVIAHRGVLTELADLTLRLDKGRLAA